jgi:hypothetical protein
LRLSKLDAPARDCRTTTYGAGNAKRVIVTPRLCQ